MTDHIVPHFHNDIGVAAIEIGAKEFMCVGAKPPFDHPHVFCDMGDDAEYVCPYCSTLYRHDPSLAANAARPPVGTSRGGPAASTSMPVCTRSLSARFRHRATGSPACRFP